MGTIRNPTILFAQDLSWFESRAFPAHVHDMYQLDYFYKGTGRITVVGQDYAVKPGDLFIVNPNVEHDFLAARQHPMEGISFKFDLRVDGKGPEFPTYVGNLSQLSLVQQRELENYLRRACDEANQAGKRSHQLAATLLSVFFILLLRYLDDSKSLSSANSGQAECHRVLEYIKRHYSKQLTLADLARVAGLKPQYFCRKFSKEVGISPIAALTRERIEAAKKLLTCTRLPITEVGLRVGYQDTYHFSKRFKEVTGMSPKQFRQHGDFFTATVDEEFSHRMSGTG